MFRNLTMYRFPEVTATAIRNMIRGGDDIWPLADALDIECQKPIGPLETRSIGWVSPYEAGFGLFATVGDCVLLTLGIESKLLPSAAVNAAVSKRITETSASEDAPLSRRARQRIKDEVVTDMLPRAIVVPSRLSGYLDLSLGVLFVDTASRKAADEFVSHFRRTLGSFPAIPLNAEIAPRAVLTDWLWNCGLGKNERPENLHIGDECELQEPVSDGAIWRGRREDLSNDAVTKQLALSRVCTRLSLTLSDRLSYVLGDDLVVRKLRLLDAAYDDMGGSEDINAELNARFTILSGEVRSLFGLLKKAFNISEAETCLSNHPADRPPVLAGSEA